MSKILIPLRNTAENESIEVSTTDMMPASEIVEILKEERVPLPVWTQLGLAYYRLKRYDEFVSILELSGSDAAVDYAATSVVQTDQMKALDILAAYFAREGYKNKEQRIEYFKKATLLYTTADQLKMLESNHLSGRAYYCFLESGSNTQKDQAAQKMDQAAQQFNYVLKQTPEHIPAMLGTACVAFNKKDYKKALYFYKGCLRINPNGPAEFRVGIGYCLVRMGKIEKARLAFERALELDPLNVAALTALAIIEGNEHTVEGVQAGITRLGQAYKLESENSVVLVHLANHFFFRGDLDRAETLAWHAFNSTESDQIKSEASFQLARCFHHRKDYDKAFKYYYQATTLNHPTFILPYFGLGQLYIQRSEYNQAVEAFEKILKQYPNNVETLKALGSLYAHSDPDNQVNRIKARDTFVKLLTMQPDDTEVLIDLAQLLEHSDPAKSLQHYEQASKLLVENDGVDVPAEMFNNIGSLHMQQGNYEKARDCFVEAESKLKEDIENGAAECAGMLVTIQYNIARCLEYLCLYEDAEKLYKKILRDRPNYTDCLMRLGCLCRDRGQIYDASMLFKEALQQNQAHADAWALIGNLHMAKHEWGPAQKKFEHILKMPDLKHDAYSLIALGNIWLEALSNPSRDRQHDDKYIERALQMFQKVLKIQPRNMWAANGIGCIFAFKKQWMESRDVFTQVREATADFFDVWVNIAHVYMESKQFVPAVQMYTNAMKKFNRENDPHMQMYLARALYRANKLQEAREAMERAVFECPDSILLKFNQAYIMKKMAKNVLEDLKSTTKMVNGAIADLKIAERILTFIKQNKDETLTGVRFISRSMSGEEARECSDLLKQAQTYLSRAKLQDEEENRIRAKQEEEREALKQRMKQESFEKEEARKRKEEELRTLRHSYVEMTKDILKMPEIVEEKKSRGGGGRKKKGGEGEEFVNDSSDMGDWRGAEGEEGGPRRKKDKSSKKASRKKREKRIGSGSDEEDDKDKEERRRRKKEAAAKKVDAKLSSKQSAKIKSRAYLSSDDDSSDGAPAPKASGSDDDNQEVVRERFSDSEEGETKKIKKKPAPSDSELNSDSDPPVIRGSDSDDERPPPASPSDQDDSDMDGSPVKKKKPVDSEEESD